MPHEDAIAPEQQAQATQADADTAASRQDSLAAAAPPADEPLDPSSVNALGEIISVAIPRLTDGQVPEEKVMAQPVQEAQEMLPPDIFANVMTVASFMQSASDAGVAAAGPYAFDPLELSKTNAGLQEMAAMVSSMGEDEKLKNALKQPQQEAPEEEAPAPEPTAADAAEELV